MISVALVRPVARTAGGWRSIGNYAANIQEAGKGLFSSSVVGASAKPFRNPFDGARQTFRGALRASELVHLTHQVLTPCLADARPRPTVVTLHDFIPLMFLSRQVDLGHFWAWQFKKTARPLNHLPLVFANSECTSRDAQRIFGLRPSQIRVIPVPIARAFFDERPVPAELPVIGDGPVILSIGTQFANKNLPLLLEALARPNLAHVALLRVGASLTRGQRKTVEQLGLSRRVFELGEIPFPGLLSAMARGTVLAQPSVYEGFGMPVAEAMAFGLPVVCSDGGALPEVAADAARIVPLRKKDYGPPDAKDVRDFAVALAEVIESPSEQARLREAGYVNARRFHPDAVGPQLLAGYEEVLRRCR